MKLNLGCSDNIIEDFINVDIAMSEGVDLIADLSKSWPWVDNSIAYIFAADIIEHLPDKIFTMNEAWRVLANEAILHIIVPTTNGMGAWQDPTHVSYWNINSFKYYQAGSPYRERFAKAYGIKARFNIIQYRLFEDETWKDGEKLSIVLSKLS